MRTFVFIVATAEIAAAITQLPYARAESAIDRGKYLVTFGGCNDCHTPGYFFGKPDMTKYLGRLGGRIRNPGSWRLPGTKHHT